MTRALGMDSLFANGSVIDLDVGEYRARTAMKLADLGIADSNEVHKAFKLGVHRLISSTYYETIREIASTAKRAVEYSSLTFPFVRGARYVPNAKLPALLERLKELKEAHAAAADEFAFEKYAEARAEQEPLIRKALVDATDTPEIAEAAYERVMSEYPEPEVVRSKFYLKWNVYAIRGVKAAGVAEAVEGEADNVKGIVRSMVEQLRGELVEKVGPVMAAIARGGKVPEPTIASAKEAVERIRSMNVFGDRILDEQMNVLARAIATVEANGSRTYKNRGMIGELANIQTVIDQSIEAAVAEAEQTLTGVGKRKLDVRREAVA